MSEVTKVCTKCGIEKLHSEFYHLKYKNMDRLKSECKSCSNKRGLQIHTKRYLEDKEYREKITTKNREYRKKRYNEDPIYRKKCLEHQRSINRKKGMGPRTNKVCDILKEHHEELKDDPEHLSCDFLKKIIGVDCK
jgi:hypothetical protein